MQTRRMSAVEVAANYLAGFAISWAMAYWLLPLWGFEQAAGAATVVTGIYTVVSVVRSYLVRRVFNSFAR